MFYKAITIGAVMLVWSAPVVAQQRGTVEFGAFGTAGKFNKSLTLDRGIGVGGRVGVYLDPRWALEFEMGEMDAQRTLGLANVNVGILSSRIVATPIKSGAVSILLGAGAGGSTETNFLHSYGVNALLGTKINLNDRVAFRVDAVADWLANNDWKSYQRLQAGLTFSRSPRTVERVVEVAAPVMPCNCVQRDDSVSAAEQARRRSVERAYNELRDSLNRAPASSLEARNTMEERIQFAFDKSELSNDAKAALDAKVAVFRANPTMTIEITGHAGNMGTDKYNVALGTRRAQAARSYLISQGIEGRRISIDSKGESQPVVSPKAVGMEANAPNRRDMFRLIVVPDVIKKP